MSNRSGLLWNFRTTRFKKKFETYKTEMITSKEKKFYKFILTQLKATNPKSNCTNLILINLELKKLKNVYIILFQQQAHR